MWSPVQKSKRSKQKNKKIVTAEQIKFTILPIDVRGN